VTVPLVATRIETSLLKMEKTVVVADEGAVAVEAALAVAATVTPERASRQSLSFPHSDPSNTLIVIIKSKWTVVGASQVDKANGKRRRLAKL
jgi:hypothetical protein